MKIRTFMKASIVALLLSGVVASGYDPLVVIDDANVKRVDSDRAVGDGELGTAVQTWAPTVATFNNGDNTHSVFVFQMTGVADPSIITDANFTVSLTRRFNTPVVFNVDAHVIRKDASSTVIASDYETSAQVLMKQFNVGTDAVGLYGLDAAGQTTLGTWLKNNWVEDEYVFIGLKSDPYNLDTFANNRGLEYGYQGDWNATRTDAQLTVIPEPAALGLIAFFGGAILFIRRRLTT